MKRREVDGYLDMGVTGFPKPTGIVFVDRTTGTHYLLSHDSEAEEVVLVTPVPSQWHGVTSEPTLSSPLGRVRLYVENDDIGLEVVSPGIQVTLDDEPVYTRNFSEPRVTFQITADALTTIDSPLTLTRFDIWPTS